MLMKRNLYHQVARYSKSAKKAFKVAVVGAAGGIGQPLSLLLKLNPRVAQLALHDKVDKVEMKGIVADLSHMCTTADVTAYLGEEELQCALDGADVVVVPAGMPRKPGMTRADLLTVNGDVAVLVAETVSKVCPKALVCFITNPINTLLPIAAEIMKQQNCFDPKRLFGVTTLDVVRSKTFLGAVLGVNPQKVRIPVIGGHAGTTILPIISQCKPKYTCSDEDRAKLVHRIQEGGTEVLEAKAGKGSATLSMAYAAANFVDSLLRGLSGEKNIVECSYVHSNVTEAEYFSSPLLLGPSGIQRNLGLPKLDETELKQVCALIELLKKDIEEGMKFMCERKNKK